MKIIITGASKGIGLGIARELHQAGHHVLLVARSLDLLQSVKDELVDRCDIFCYDLLQQDCRLKLLDMLKKQNLIPDAIVHNVGGRIGEDRQPLSYNALKKSIDFNLGIAVALNYYLIPRMIENGGGHILHISSDSAIMGNGAPGYVAAKSGLNAYIRSTARFYAKEGIIVNGIMPGIIDFKGGIWDMKRLSEPEKYEKVKMQQALGRFGRVDEVAKFAKDLIESSNMLTSGEIFVLNGGGGGG